MPLAQLRDVASALEEVITTRGRAELEAVMAAEDELAAAQIARGLAGDGRERSRKAFTADSLGVAQPMRPVFERLMTKLAGRGLLEEGAEGYKPPRPSRPWPIRPTELLRTFISKHPGTCRRALLCAATCAEFGAIIRGEKDAVQVLFSGPGAELLDHFYGDGLFASHWMASIAARRAGGCPSSARGSRTAHS